MMNDRMNQVLRGNTLCSDGAEHDALRDVLRRPLTPRALRPVREDITAEAEHVVATLVARGSFDAAADLANHLPVSVVSNLVGLPEKGRERMLVWAEEMFNYFGPMNDRAVASFPVLDEMMDYATNEAVPGKLKPGIRAAGIHDAVARGEVPAQARQSTASPATWHATWTWTAWCCRRGSRAIVLFGAANRDERKYPHPDRFDVLRRPGDHLGFGAGPHAGVGMNLARSEMPALFTALANRVQRFTILQQEPLLNNVLRGFKTLRIAVD
jgi:cytochrome P450